MLKNIQDIPAFCINLDRRKDRWNNFKSQSAVITMIQSGQLKRWSGIEGKQLDLLGDKRISMLCKKNIKENWRRAHEELNSIGGVGCALSHISIWKWLAESDKDAVMIFEDDAKVPYDFLQKYQIVIDNSHILQTGNYDLIVPGNTALPKSYPERFLVEVDVFFGLTCYIITKNCAKNLLAKVYPIMEHIDLWLCLYKFLYGLRIYNVNLRWLNIQQIQTKSDITPEDKCPLCNLKTDFYDYGRIVSIPDLISMRISQIAIGGFVGWWLWKRYGYHWMSKLTNSSS